MIDQLNMLEKEARLLDTDPALRADLNREVLDYVEDFLQGVEDAPAFRPEPGTLSILDEHIPESGRGLSVALETLYEQVDHVGIATTSPRFMGYIPGGGLYHSALGDMLAAVANRYAGVYFASPGAVRIENQCLKWMADLVGYPSTFGGYLSAGGSLANFTAVVTARDACGIKADAIPRSVIYLTDHAHHCIDKAIHLAGLSECVIRRIPVDDGYRMDAEALQAQVLNDEKEGLTPFFVMASAGTTNTGSVDPIEQIGQIAQTHSIWYHIDGAYGAFFALCDAGADLLKGMELSDSIVMDPHKTLFLPYGTGALLVKNQDRLLKSHQAGADYMQDVLNVEATSPATFSPELTKHFRGLRLWLPLQILGVGPFRAALQEKMLLARYFHEQLSGFNGFEVGPEPDLSVVTYRFIPDSGDADTFNERLVQAIHNDGRIFVSSTRLNGVYMLRMAALCFRTHKKDIDTALTVLKELSSALNQTH